MDISITLTERQASRLQDLTDAYNRQTGNNLGLTEWVDLHLRELAIQPVVGPSLEALDTEVNDYRNRRTKEILDAAIQSL